MSATLLKPHVEVDCPGTRDGQPIYFVTIHLDLDETDILWSGTSYAAALAVAEQWRQDDGLVVIDKVRGLD